MNDNWIKTSMVKPKEGATCLVTTQGDIALAKYSEGYFIQYGNDDVFYNNVTAWQYADAPFEDETSKYKKAINYLLNTFQSCREYSNEGEKFYLLGGWDNDRVFVVRPRRIEDIDCINTINKYINTDGTSILNYYNIGEIYILIFGADCYGSDLENYEYLTVKTASEVIKYNTQKIMDIITIMSKEETETEDN
jgi:hypothetical protein